MEKIIVRNVKKEDLRNVSEIVVNGWKTAYMGIVDDEYLDSLSVEENYQRRLEDYTENGFVVAELNNEVVGFCRYTLENLFSKDASDADGEITAIYVKPELKRNGIGKELFKYVFNEFRKNGNKSIILWCLKDNYQSRAFYEKMGGKLCGENTISRGGKEYKEVGFIFNI
jgi:ribosomal protein S18 acetylase RimI-like enzyme